MNEFQLQNEITETVRQEVGSYLEKRELELEVAHQFELIKKKYDSLLVSVGAVTLIVAVCSTFLKGSIDYFFISIFCLSIFAEFGFLFVKLNRKKRDLEAWHKTH